MFLIVGLGNPGIKYCKTRHNVGFLFIDCFASALGFSDFKAKFDSLYSEKTIDDVKIFIQKPQTFMNLSGKAVFALANFYKVPYENIIVVHDDIDLEPLKIKMKFAGSSGGHNGIKDIDRHIGNNYHRIKIGVGRPFEKDQVQDYVVSNFSTEELTELPTVFQQVAQNIQQKIAEKK
ncbi:peptidyl-tRNA hydrolase [Alphaproteobacteria bacterium]|nr:peptidyl-tRNA hydrolase [Alphaproteobacteria bacterium]